MKNIANGIAFTLIFGLAVFPAVYIYRLYVPLETK